METQPRVYCFGPMVKTVTVLGAALLIAIGVWGVANAYANVHGVVAQFGAVLLSMIPIAAALFGAPTVWRCKLSLYEDRLEYRGLVVDATIRKADIIDALAPAPHYGMFQIFLTLVGQPFKRLHIAVLGRMDDVLENWVNGLPHQTQEARI